MELLGHPRLLLAATDMQLAHPVSGQALHLQAELAGDFAEAVGKLGSVMPPHTLRFTL